MSTEIPNFRLPGTRSQAMQARRQRTIARGVSSTMNVFAARADGAIVEDVDGNKFIDFASGIGTNNVGHARAEVTHAITRQAAKFTHTCFSVTPYEPYVALAERLTQLTPGKFAKKAFFVNSGAEAVENAVKIARYATNRPAIITFDNSFHGRTLLTMTMTARVKPYKHHFGPFAPEIYRAPYPYPYRMDISPQEASRFCLDELEHLITDIISPDQVAAIIIEPVQGEGGFIVAPAEFLRGVQALCARYGILFVADEIQTGFCRTGKMFAIEHSALEPDMLLLAKSLGAGLPISGVIGRAEVMDAPPPGALGGTYGGNPVACAAALAAIDLYEKEHMAARSQIIGECLRKRFQQWQERYPCIGEIRGLGSMIALELVKDRESKEPDTILTSQILTAAHQCGLILMKAGMYDNVLRVLTPLCITDEQLEQGLERLEAAFNAVLAEVPVTASVRTAD